MAPAPRRGDRGVAARRRARARRRLRHRHARAGARRRATRRDGGRHRRRRRDPRAGPGQAGRRRDHVAPRAGHRPRGRARRRRRRRGDVAAAAPPRARRQAGRAGRGASRPGAGRPPADRRLGPAARPADGCGVLRAARHRRVRRDARARRGGAAGARRAGRLHGGAGSRAPAHGLREPGAAQRNAIRLKAIAPSATTASPIVCSGWRRRSVGLPGLKSWKAPSADVSCSEMWEWPKTTAAQPVNAARWRSSRPRAGPASCTIPIWTPPAATTRRSGSRATTSARSTLPCTAATGGPSASSSSSTDSSARAPACRIRSASRRRATHASGSARAPRGRCVSEMMARRMLLEASPTDLPPGPSLSARRQVLAWVFRPEALLERAHRERGDVVTVHLPLGPVVAVSDPRLIKDVFTGDPDVLRAGEGNRPLEPVVGPDSLLLLDGARHLRRRRLVLPPFHGERLAAYAADMAQITRDDLARWPRGTPFALEPHLRAITLAIIIRVVFGIEDAGRAAALRDLIPRLVPDGGVASLLLLPALRRDLGPRSPWGRFVAARAAIDALLLSEIAARRADPRVGERADILSLLLAARDEDGAPLTDRELRDELMTLLIAGHETTASALAWAFTLLPHARPDAIALARGDDAWLDAVASETLRLKPPLPLAVRRSSE